MSRPLRESTGDAVHASPMVDRAPASASRSLAIALIAALFMTFVGAVGTGEVAVGSRLLYWLMVMMTGALIGLGVAGGIHQWGRLRTRPIVEGALVSVLIALPLSVVVVMANIFFLGAARPDAISFTVVTAVVLVISALLTTINYAMAQPTPVPAPPVTVEPTMTEVRPPALLSRLPMHLRGARLIALQAEDHYLRVHTDRGSALILLRMGDAMAELGDIDGRRVHRSWWVAREAIASTSSDKGRTLLRLDGGLEVPVSRSSRPELARDGWLG